VSDTVGTAVPDRGKGRDSGDRPGFGARIALFYRQVVAELRKVVWPTRKELLTYTWVVIVFVAVIAMIVAVLDFGFAKLVLKVFGS
jgi:preprotein translocase subunit SecE